MWPICYETVNITHSMHNLNFHNIPFLLCIHTELQSAVHTFMSTCGTQHTCSPKHQYCKAHKSFIYNVKLIQIQEANKLAIMLQIQNITLVSKIKGNPYKYVITKQSGCAVSGKDGWSLFCMQGQHTEGGVPSDSDKVVNH